MNILVITGSPHKKGTSSLLADNFIAGALEAGHEVFRFDLPGNTTVFSMQLLPEEQP